MVSSATTGVLDFMDQPAGPSRLIPRIHSSLGRRVEATLARALRPTASRSRDVPPGTDGTAPDGAEAIAAKQQAAIAKLVAKAEAVIRRGEPIVAGPWVGELAFELLYWIPFVRWLGEKFDLRGRLTVVSCGGNASWYGDLAERYVDVFDLMSLDELRELRKQAAASEESAAEWSKGERRVRLSPVGGKTGAGDQASRAILARVAERARLDAFSTLDPSLAWSLSSNLRKLEAAGGDALGAVPLRFARIAPPAVDLSSLRLPERFVAARFYAGTGTSHKRGGPEIVRAAIEGIALLGTVVLLDPGVRVDDKHHDFPLEGADVVRIPPLPLPGNLAVQTAIISRAQAFVGSYGGFSWLPPLLGVPTVAVSTRSLEADPHLRFHTALARRMVACDPSCGDYVIASPDTMDVLRLVLPVTQALRAGSS